MKKIIYFAGLIFLFIFSSCSLNYGDKKEQKFDKMPNFVFKSAYLDRYEKGKLDLRINFKNLEIYDAEKIWAGETVHFSQFDKEANKKKFKNNLAPVESKGYAGLIKIDDKNNKYFFGDKVFFENVKENLLISGEAFFWNKKDHILYAPENEVVTVKKSDEFSIKGSGFIANTMSREFEFLNSIEGKIKTSSNKEQNND